MTPQGATGPRPHSPAPSLSCSFLLTVRGGARRAEQPLRRAGLSGGDLGRLPGLPTPGPPSPTRGTQRRQPPRHLPQPGPAGSWGPGPNLPLTLPTPAPPVARPLARGPLACCCSVSPELRRSLVWDQPRAMLCHEPPQWPKVESKGTFQGWQHCGQRHGVQGALRGSSKGGAGRQAAGEQGGGHQQGMRGRGQGARRLPPWGLQWLHKGSLERLCVAPTRNTWKA